MAETVKYVRCDDGLVHGLSPFVDNVTGCGLGYVAHYQHTDDAPTCLRCIAAEGTWREILVRAIERRKRQQ